MSYGLANEFVVFTVGADPKPMHSCRYGNAKCSIKKAYSDAMKSPITDGLEMQ
jgi:hypothetical protein